MNDASGLEPGKTTTIFAERKVIELSATDKPFKLQNMLKTSWNSRGLVTCTGPSFDKTFVQNRIVWEQPAPARRVVVTKLFGSANDRRVIQEIGRESIKIGFLDIDQLLGVEKEADGTVFPLYGRTYFFARDPYNVLCLCFLMRDEDGWRIDCLEMGQRLNSLSGSVIHRFDDTCGT